MGENESCLFYFTKALSIGIQNYFLTPKEGEECRFRVIESNNSVLELLDFEGIEIYYLTKLKLINPELVIEHPLNANKLHSIYHENDIIEFGKFQGKSIAEIYEIEPSYLIWCILNLNNFILDESFLSENYFDDNISVLSLFNFKILLNRKYGFKIKSFSYVHNQDNTKYCEVKCENGHSFNIAVSNNINAGVSISKILIGLKKDGTFFMFDIAYAINLIKSDEKFRKVKEINTLKLLRHYRKLRSDNEWYAQSKSWDKNEQYSNDDAFDSPEQYRDFLASH